MQDQTVDTETSGYKENSEDRLFAPESQLGEKFDQSLRPQRLQDYIGQNEIKENLHVFIGAAIKRGHALDHVLLSGPPGLGKTTLANIFAREMEVQLRSTSGPVIERQGDLAAILTNLDPGSILFIDEIHRLNRVVEEVLYGAMEDFTLDIIIGEGPGARTVKIDLPHFTLVGATTRAGLLSSPLRERFGIRVAGGQDHPPDLGMLAQVLEDPVRWPCLAIGSAHAELEALCAAGRLGAALVDGLHCFQIVGMNQGPQGRLSQGLGIAAQRPLHRRTVPLEVALNGQDEHQIDGVLEHGRQHEGDSSSLSSRGSRAHAARPVRGPRVRGCPEPRSATGSAPAKPRRRAGLAAGMPRLG